MNKQEIIDPTNWARIGPGRGTDFNATADDVALVLRDRLVDEYHPYGLVTIESKKKGRKYEWTAHEHEISAFGELTLRGEWFFFIRSLAIHPHVNWTDFEIPQGVCGVNGMINLQFNHESASKYRSSIGIVWKVGNLLTNEVIIHHEYLKIFEPLQRAFRKLRRKVP